MRTWFVLLLAVPITACGSQSSHQANSTAQQVANGASAAAQNAYLVTAIKGKLTGIDADALTAVNVSVRTGGDVTLSGKAHTPLERARYASAARSVSGVHSVTNQIAVAGNFEGVRGQTNDAAIAAAVEANIAANAGISVFHVAPSVRDAIVTLTGTVNSTAVRDTIDRTVRNTSGVRGVIDRIDARP